MPRRRISCRYALAKFCSIVLAEEQQSHPSRIKQALALGEADPTKFRQLAAGLLLVLSVEGRYVPMLCTCALGLCSLEQYMVGDIGNPS